MPNAERKKKEAEKKLKNAAQGQQSLTAFFNKQREESDSAKPEKNDDVAAVEISDSLVTGMEDNNGQQPHGSQNGTKTKVH